MQFNWNPLRPITLANQAKPDWLTVSMSKLKPGNFSCLVSYANCVGEQNYKGAKQLLIAKTAKSLYLYLPVCVGVCVGIFVFGLWKIKNCNHVNI